jgi:deferrochelatase/peroxidase EfeB
LTITIGFGTTLFQADDGRDRFGLAARRPPQLADLPAFPGDALITERSGGDLCIQACANDPQVAAHAIRNLARIARGTAVVRYSQLGFGRTSSTSTSQQTARNLMGFKDGTNNIKAEDSTAVDRFVWAQRGDGATG